MKEIQLTQGKVAMVDDADYEWLNQWKWYAHKHPKGSSFYAIRNCCQNGKWISIKMHRIILGLTDPKVPADHKDGNGLNNQRYNLRGCNRAENNRNVPPKRCGFSQYKGVALIKKTGKWNVRIRHNSKALHIGNYDTAEEAAKAYNEAAIKYHGEFAWTNQMH